MSGFRNPTSAYVELFRGPEGCQQVADGRGAVKNPENVILSEAKDLCSCPQIIELHGTAEILRGVYPERTAEILRFAQNDKRRTPDDSRPIG